MSIFNDRIKETYNVARNLLGTPIWRICASHTLSLIHISEPTRH